MPLKDVPWGSTEYLKGWPVKLFEKIAKNVTHHHSSLNQVAVIGDWELAFPQAGVQPKRKLIFIRLFGIEDKVNDACANAAMALDIGRNTCSLCVAVEQFFRCLLSRIGPLTYFLCARLVIIQTRHVKHNLVEGSTGELLDSLQLLKV